MIKEVAAAVSTQAQVSNRTWLGLLSIAGAALLPRTASTSTNELILPFGLGETEAGLYYIILFVILVVVTLAFSAAQVQSVRAQKLAQSFIDSIVQKDRTVGGMHPRELFDMMRVPNLNRVAPLAQALRGRYQFYATQQGCPRWLRVVSTSYFFLLRLVSIIIYYGLPFVALSQLYIKIHLAHCSGWLIAAGGILAAGVLFQVLVGDIVYLMETLPRIWSGGS